MTGINIKCRFGPTGSLVIRVYRVTVKDGMNEIDETDSESGGYGDCDDNGVAQADVTLEGWVRRLDAGPLVVGDLVPNVLVAWDGNVATPDVDKRHFFPKLKILSIDTTGEIRGGSISYNLTCKSSGIYYPMGVAGGTALLRKGAKRPEMVEPNRLREPPAEGNEEAQPAAAA